MEKYRIVKTTNYLCSKEPWVRYVIEKRVKFLFWTWWSRDYLFDRVYTHYEYGDFKEAERVCKLLNKGTIYKEEWK